MSDRRGETGAAMRAGDDGGKTEGRAEPSGGWRSQSRGLKILLFVSVAIAVFAVVRCSMELGSGPPAADSISVLRPSLDLPEGVLPAPPDSIAMVAARQMARVLGEASGLRAAVVDSVTGGNAVLARFSMTSSSGNVTISLELLDTKSRVLSRAESEGPPEHLYAVVGVAARRAAADVWPLAAGDERGQ